MLFTIYYSLFTVLMGWLKVFQGNEEEKLYWRQESEEDVREAKERFLHYLRQGFIACKISGQGQTGVQITEFDPEAEEIFMLGLVDGG